MLLLNLRLSVLKASLSALPPPILSGQLRGKLLILLLSGGLRRLFASLASNWASFTHSLAMKTS